ncbi:DNA alkylation repair protein [Streptomyces sp. YC504]|uniref:DNA alkylation repair protein n=1 Tax=Streptomyces mesophilus TaxID=1775132 RepID=A0A6G4XK93_9ACTN|nr:DNA alkylation repair protein [Streptomyces mesophilus]NGO77124.1 DNA alkylation repair protein [Streptomyces mesophilus]
MPAERSAEQFAGRLTELATPERQAQLHRALQPGRGRAEEDLVLGVRMGSVFTLAKEFIDLVPREIDRLLDSPVHEVRVGAVSIMGKQALHKKTGQERRRELYELYLRRTDAINTWDLVDVSAHQVIGAYLHDFGEPRTVLRELAASPRWWERRIAMFATLYLLRKGELDDTYELAELLVHDPHDLVQKVVGGMLREAGKHDRDRLLAFLDRHAATAPRPLLRDAIEHLDKELRAHYLGLAR